MSKKKKKYVTPPSCTQHFNDRLLERYVLTNDELEEEIINKIKGGYYKNVTKTDKKGVYKYRLYTYGSILFSYGALTLLNTCRVAIILQTMR